MLSQNSVLLVSQNVHVDLRRQICAFVNSLSVVE